MGYLFIGKFDLITLCDVLEHLNDESAAVMQ